MNSLRSKRVFMRSMATRRQHAWRPASVLKDCIAFLRGQGYDLVIVETAGIGQSDSEIVDLVDFPMYVMTSDYGAASQLEKIDMIDFAELIVLNKYDKRGAEDALRDVRKQWKRNRVAFKLTDEEVPVYPTIASQFNDPGVTWMFVNLCRLMREKLHLGDRSSSSMADAKKGTPSPPNPPLEGEGSSAHAAEGSASGGGRVKCRRDCSEALPFKGRVGWGWCCITLRLQPASRHVIEGETARHSADPRPARVRYLAEIAEQGRGINGQIGKQSEAANRAQTFWQTLKELGDQKLPNELDLYNAHDLLSTSRSTSDFTSPLVGEVAARRAAGEGLAPQAPASQSAPPGHPWPPGHSGSSPSQPLSPTRLPQGERGFNRFHLASRTCRSQLTTHSPLSRWRERSRRRRGVRVAHQ